MNFIDYGRSFLHGRWAGNRVRFVVESRTRLIDDRAGTHADYYQCASCKSEDTFAERDLFYADNYDFLPVFGPEDGVIFRRKAYLNDDYKATPKAAEMWGGQDYRLHHPDPGDVIELETNAAIRRATHDGLPLVARTTIHNADTEQRAIIECPIKTMNIHDERDLYQVDTGPVVLPDLSQRYERAVTGMALAFVAFNAPDFADFVVEAPTPIEADGRTVTQVHHYSKRLTFAAANRLYAIRGA